MHLNDFRVLAQIELEAQVPLMLGCYLMDKRAFRHEALKMISEYMKRNGNKPTKITASSDLWASIVEVKPKSKDKCSTCGHDRLEFVTDAAIAGVIVECDFNIEGNYFYVA